MMDGNKLLKITQEWAISYTTSIESIMFNCMDINATKQRNNTQEQLCSTLCMN